MPKAAELQAKTGCHSACETRGKCEKTCGPICGCRLRRSSSLLPLWQFWRTEWERRAAARGRAKRIGDKGQSVGATLRFLPQNGRCRDLASAEKGGGQVHVDRKRERKTEGLGSGEGPKSGGDIKDGGGTWRIAAGHSVGEAVRPLSSPYGRF